MIHAPGADNPLGVPAALTSLPHDPTPCHSPRSKQAGLPALDSPGRRMSKGIITLGLAIQATFVFGAGPDQIMAGTGLMHLREPPRVAYASVEAIRFPGDGWIGGWAGLDGAPRDHFLGFGPIAKVELSRHFRLMLGTGPGLCSNDAAAKLGFRYEYRSSAYLVWKRRGGHDITLSVSHYSNGGMSSRNPGAEGVRLLYSFPLPRK